MSHLAIGAALLLAHPVLVVAQEQPLAPLPPALPRTHPPQPTTPAITAADLMTRLYIFADDSLQGRDHGSRGNAKGTAYIAAEVQRMGLMPAGDSGTFFQNIPDPACRPVLMDVSMRIGNAPLTIGQDFLPVGPHSLHNAALDVVYGGQTGTPFTLTPRQVSGKLVVFTVPAATRIDSLVPIPSVAGAAGVALVVLDSIAPRRRARMVDRNMVLHTRPESPVILLSGAAAQRLFGKALGELLPGATGMPAAVAYTFVASARNVVAILPGSDPVLRKEYVAMGAHNDHIGWQLTSVGDHDSLRAYTHFASPRGAEQGGGNAHATPAQMDSINAALTTLRKLNSPRRDSIFNGADDDGSASMGMLEIAEQLAAMPVKPKRSIIFVWYANEEDGESGSSWFVAHLPVPRDAIVADLDADMIGRGDASDFPGGGPNYMWVVDSHARSTEFANLIERVNRDDRHDFVFDYVRSARYAGASDDGPFMDLCPVAVFSTGVHSDYHMVTDEPEYIDYAKMARVTALISDVAVHVANLDHRLASDHSPSH